MHEYLTRWVPRLTLGFYLTCCTAAAQPLPHRIIELQGKDIPEASGLAYSPTRQLFWTHNDGEYGPYIYALGLAGERLARVKLVGASNSDWEDIAAFTDDGRPQLMLADTGDNNGSRGKLTLYFIDEPQLPDATDKPTRLRAQVTRKIEFTLPDGASDLEGAAVDSARGEILLLAKRENPPSLYRLPLHPGDGPTVATRVTRITSLPPAELNDLKANLTLAAFLRQPVALDYDPAGDRYLLTTYADAHIYPRGQRRTLAETFAQTPRTLQLPLLPQMEGGTFCGVGSYCFISEKLPAKLLIAQPR